MKQIFFTVLVLILFLSDYLAQNKNQNDTLKHQLKQVTITATRYEEPIMEIPYSVTLLSPKQFETLNGFGLNDALSNVPGVLAQTRSGGQDIKITIRGFGARGAGDRSNAGTSRGVRVMTDGIPETEPDGRTSFDLMDIAFAENIEVVRSNASALWGNASGGIINLSTIPVTNEPFLSVNQQTGGFGMMKTTLKAGTTFSNGKIYGAVANTVFDGWRDHSRSYRTSFNIGLIANIAQRTRLGVYLAGASSYFAVPGPLTKTQFDQDPQQAYSTYKQRDERRNNRLGRIGVTIDHSITNHDEISAMVYVNPKYLQRSERGTFRDFTRYHFGGNMIYKKSFNFSDNVKNRFSAGFDEAYQDGAILFYSLSASNQRGTTLKDNKREGANNFGLFVQNEIIFSDKVSLILGARYDNVTYYSESYMVQGYGLQQKSFERLTPKAGITYLFSPTHSIYANIGGGIEVPAGNETDPTSAFGDDKVYLLNPLLEAIKSNTYEIGTKQVVFFGNHNFVKSVMYNAAFYYIDVTNDIIPYQGGKFYLTAGKTNRYGIELSFNTELDYGLSFDANLTYSANKYADYTVDSVHYGKPGKLVSYKDNKVAGIPDYFYKTTLKFNPEFFNTISLAFSVKGVSSYYVDDINITQVPSYAVCDLTLNIEKPVVLTGNIKLGAFVNVSNLFDIKYAESAFINPAFVNGAPVYLEPGLPQNISAGVKLTF